MLRKSNKQAEKDLQEKCADSIDFADSNLTGRSRSRNRSRNSKTTVEEKPPAYKVFKSEAVTAVRAEDENAADSPEETILLVVIAVLCLILVVLTGVYCLQKRRK